MCVNLNWLWCVLQSFLNISPENKLWFWFGLDGQHIIDPVLLNWRNKKNDNDDNDNDNNDNNANNEDATEGGVELNYT